MDDTVWVITYEYYDHIGTFMSRWIAAYTQDSVEDLLPFGLLA
jgi:hypothetical protein